MPSKRSEPNVHDSRGQQCPLPRTHDRFDEAHWFFHQMLEYYHEPTNFRFSTNAFLSALKSVVDMLRLDLEKLGQNEWRKARFKEFSSDPLFRAFARGRDIVVHQGPLIHRSTGEIGLFRGRSVKLALNRDLRTAESSTALLARLREVIREHGGGPFVPGADERWVGEQLGVRRLYFVPELSDSDDVVTASHAVWMKVGDLLDDAHRLFNMSFDSHDERAGDEHDVERVCVLLESDVDPSLPEKWGW